MGQPGSWSRGGQQASEDSGPKGPVQQLAPKPLLTRVAGAVGPAISCVSP